MPAVPDINQLLGSELQAIRLAYAAKQDVDLAIFHFMTGTAIREETRQNLEEICRIAARTKTRPAWPESLRAACLIGTSKESHPTGPLPEVSTGDLREMIEAGEFTMNVGSRI